MKRMLLRIRDWMMDYAYLVTLGAVIAVIVGSALYTRQVERDIQAAAPAPETAETGMPTPQATPEPLPTLAPLTARPMQLVTTGAWWPVEGEILRGFDEQALVCWESLGSWRTHTALDIAGEAGQAVACCADGTVERSTWDALWGWRVTVSQRDGQQVSYCGLESSLVWAGESVQRGQSLGTLMARIPCEAELPPHLHLELRHKGRLQDPEAMLAER